MINYLKKTILTYKIKNQLLIIILKKISIVFTVFIYAGCTSIDTHDNYTLQLNQSHKQHTLQTSTGLPITIWTPKNKKKSDTVRLYIEGDGKAWARRNRMSSDPTPHNRLVHGLMLEDPKHDIAYIARPCQFIQNNQCTPKLWTFSRYNETSVQAIDEAVQKIKDQFNYRLIELVGFSGGATIALILSTRRNDIVSVRTVAGNLDPAYTNKLHAVTPMPNALNPSHKTDKLQHVPQWHFIGTKDRIIKESIYTHYLSQFKNKQCINHTIVKNASHSHGWIEQWRYLLEHPPQCNSKKMPQ